jgi:hypothetical protein
MKMEAVRTKQDRYKFNHIMKYSLMAMVGYIIIFAVARLFNYHLIVELRALNYIVYFIVALFAIKTFKEESEGGMSYLEGFLTGLFVGKVSFGLYAFLMYLYLKFVDRIFLSYLVDYAPLGIELTPLASALLIFFEGQAIGVVTGLILMQYFKKNINKISRTI